MSVLVTGFGPFHDVNDNPSGSLARVLDGRVVAGARVTGLELPVTWGSPHIAVDRARTLGARLVIGLGVDRRTRTIDVETRGYNVGDGVDNAGERRAVLEPSGPALRFATVDARAFADAIGGRVDDDAGRYVCNAWLYGVVGGLPGRGVVFVHVPHEGMSVEALVRGIEVLMRGVG